MVVFRYKEKKMEKNFFRVSMVLLAVALLTSCSRDQVVDSPSERYVKTIEVAPFFGEESSSFNGVVKERRQIGLSFNVGGPISELLVNEGDYVKKGQVVARIDKRDYQVQLLAAKARFIQAKSEYDRYQKLYDRKKLPENTLEKLEAGYLMAKSQYERAKNALEDTDLKAPFSGYVHSKSFEKYEVIEAGYPVVSLIDFEKLEVVVNLPENQVARMKQVKEVNCDIKNASQFGVSATIKSLSEKSGADNLYELRTTLNMEEANGIKPGMAAKVKVVYNEEEKQRIVVPVEAVFETAGSRYVWVVNPANMQVEKRSVKPGKVFGNGRMELLSGITVGDVVVAAGVHALVENQKVKILKKKSETNIGGLL